MRVTSQGSPETTPNEIANEFAVIRELIDTKRAGDVERHLTGKLTEAWEIIYFKVYKSQLPVIEQALETAALMLGSDKSRAYMLEMICADFLAGANTETADSHTLLLSLARLFALLPELRQQEFLNKAKGPS